MVHIVQESTKQTLVCFCREGADILKELPESVSRIFQGKRLETAWTEGTDGKVRLLVGMGSTDKDKMHLKELGAKAAKECLEKKIREFSIDMSLILKEYGAEALGHIAEGAVLGTYKQKAFKKEEKEEAEIELCRIPAQMETEAASVLAEALSVAEGTWFARDMVNLPGNKLRPQDFAEEAMEFVKGTQIAAELVDEAGLRELGLEALLGVGDSSAYPPCMLVLRYAGDAKSKRVTGLIGKGVTCDTGGYCLKPANSMLGIKGDMAGGAAVIGAIYALAKNQVKANAVAVIPMCENRISQGSLLPGDVISSYAGKSIEIANTDAEGRLILADAVSYAVKKEGVTEILDIATLTGAVVNLLGFTVGGVLCDDDALYERFSHAFETSGERYLRVPFYEEHEKMIESKVADIRNMSSNGCGTITAGLFIRAFAEEKPWIHLDIAGTAWVDSPFFEFQTEGATGAGVSTLYQLCAGHYA